MYNYYELLDMINLNEMTAEKASFISALRNEFRNDFADNCKAIKTTAYATKQGRESFIKNAKHKDTTIKGLYCTDCQILSINDNLKDDGVHELDLSNIIKGFLSAEKKPCDLYLKESLAVAKSLGYKYGDKNYMVEVDGNFYAMDRLYEVFRCLGSNCEYGQILTYNKECHTDIRQGRQPLMIQGNNCFSVVLPVLITSINRKYDCTYKHYIANERDLDEKINKAVTLTA